MLQFLVQKKLISLYIVHRMGYLMIPSHLIRTYTHNFYWDQLLLIRKVHYMEVLMILYHSYFSLRIPIFLIFCIFNRFRKTHRCSQLESSKFCVCLSRLMLGVIYVHNHAKMKVSLTDFEITQRALMNDVNCWSWLKR